MSGGRRAAQLKGEVRARSGQGHWEVRARSAGGRREIGARSAGDRREISVHWARERELSCAPLPLTLCRLLPRTGGLGWAGEWQGSCVAWAWAWAWRGRGVAWRGVACGGVSYSYDTGVYVAKVRSWPAPDLGGAPHRGHTWRASSNEGTHEGAGLTPASHLASKQSRLSCDPVARRSVGQSRACAQSSRHMSHVSRYLRFSKSNGTAPGSRSVQDQSYKEEVKLRAACSILRLSVLTQWGADPCAPP